MAATGQISMILHSHYPQVFSPAAVLRTGMHDLKSWNARERLNIQHCIKGWRSSTVIRAMSRE